MNDDVLTSLQGRGQRWHGRLVNEDTLLKRALAEIADLRARLARAEATLAEVQAQAQAGDGSSPLKTDK